MRAEKGLTGEYLIRVYDENFSTRYEVSVERAQGSDEPFDAVAARVTAALKAHTGVKPARVIVYDAGKLGTSSEHKASRFIRARQREVGNERANRWPGGTLCSAIGYHFI